LPGFREAAAGGPERGTPAAPDVDRAPRFWYEWHVTECTLIIRTMNGKSESDGRGMGKGRIEALTDGIFAVAMTLLVLDIKPPVHLRFETSEALIDHLSALEHSLVMYAISFVVLAMFWLGHHLQFHFVRHVDRPLLWVNLAFLLLAVVVPFSTNLVGDHGHLQFPVFLYAANLLALSLLLFLQLRHLVASPHLTAPHLTREAVTHLQRQLVLFLVVPLASVAVSFHSPRWGMYVYALLVVPAFVPGRIDRLTRPETDGGEPAP
jgi:uncharacterized membrane protein